MTDNEKIEHLNKYQNKGATVLAIYRKLDKKTEKITIGDVVDIINRQQAEIERLNNLKRFEKFICERIHTDKERNLTWDFATKEAEQEAFEQELEKLFDISTARAEAIKEFAEMVKIKSYELEHCDDEIFKVVDVSDIDNLVKEMVGEDK